jgi:ABC-2 type transport system permease protein
MAGISCIVKKEISDAVSNKAFFLSCAVLLLISSLTSITASNVYYNLRLFPGGKTNYELVIMRELFPKMVLIGALVAVAYGFNAINKERTEGSLKVLMSYPIYRDQVILGKLFASIILITFVSFVSQLVSLSLYLFQTNIVFTIEKFSIYFTFMCLTTLLLIGYLGLSMFFSIAFRDQKTSLILMFVIIGVFNSLIFYSYGELLIKVIYGPDLGYRFTPLGATARAIYEWIQTLSIADSLRITIERLMWNRFPVNLGEETIWIDNSILRVLTYRINTIILLVIIPVLSFSASYVFFTRRDIT